MKEAESEFVRLITESNRSYTRFQGPADPREWDGTAGAREEVLAPLKQAAVLCDKVMKERMTLISTNQELITDSAEIQTIADGFEIMQWVVQTKISSLERTDPPKLDDRLRKSRLMSSWQERVHPRWRRKRH
ncbi:MAG: hypothetical protein ACRDHZ_25045 [Ktedonobacteraceae bacterium]